MKINENPSSANRVVPHEETGRQGRADSQSMTKLDRAVRDIPRAPYLASRYILQIYVNAAFQPCHSFLRSSLPIRNSALYALLFKLSRATRPAHLIALNVLQ